ncbi:GNAT family N-acetyltransferase [Microtetraspora sp. AC03309]|uniref:GNAT family N-acetyltransferase n=1 Tax=Microtetraspora sp. AC03309 TaxID=2779376 RepID=UPI001E3DC474|nr:GNAT family N-acetyltransferase [Microtetraspora sp. AC03309]MCC5581987.1 GNAT family N-acetyltransferase [Microtetraspora sp. AC03309]
MPSPSEFVLLLREIPVHPHLEESTLLAAAVADAAAEVSPARCRMYVLADIGRPAASPPLAAALVETERTGRLAWIRALAVAEPFRRRGLGRRLLADLLTELRADGVREVGCAVARGTEREQVAAGQDLPVLALLRGAGFGPPLPGTGERWRAFSYDSQETRRIATDAAVLLTREL